MAKEKNLTTVTTVAAADFARIVTSAGASVKATAANLAKYIVETYNGSTIAGSAQSVKSALDSLNSKFITTECRGNSSFDLPIENDKHYLITMMTSSATSARAILISRRDTFVELVELGAGSWQSYFTETLSNNTWHITCSYYTIIKIVVL